MLLVLTPESMLNANAGGGSLVFGNSDFNVTVDEGYFSDITLTENTSALTGTLSEPASNGKRAATINGVAGKFGLGGDSGAASGEVYISLPKEMSTDATITSMLSCNDSRVDIGSAVISGKTLTIRLDSLYSSAYGIVINFNNVTFVV